MKRVTLLLLSGMLFTQLFIAGAQEAGDTPEGGKEVPLPGQRLTLDASAATGPGLRSTVRAALPEGASVLVNPRTGTAHRAFGGGMRIPGYAHITTDNIEAAANAFLSAYRDALGIAPDHLVLQRVSRVRGRWYVTWRQQHDGMDVLLSEVELRVFDNGSIAAFGAEVYPECRIQAMPRIGAEEAWEAAVEGLDTERGLRKAVVRRTAVLPVGGPGDLRYRLVYEMPVVERSGHRWTSYVDASNGDLLWRRAETFDAVSGLRSHGGVTVVHPHEPELTDRSFGDMYVTVDGRKYTTDADGRLAVDIPQAASVTASFEGPWCKVVFSDRDEGRYSGTLQPGDSLDIAWTDENSHRFERILFYHTNLNRTFLRSIDPEFDAMDFQTTVEVEFDGMQPNAMSNGDMVRFLAAGHASMRMASAPMVLYHELGHSLNIKMYEALGAQGGMQNGACQEGMADLHAALITDYPAMGTGVFTDDEDRVMRHLENTMVYPDSLVGESHHDGQVLSGAFWDLRQATSLATARELAHFAKYGLPDDPDDGIAFAEWFLETLVADDDDGDLTNGTPHAGEIIAAFGRHDIGLDLYMVTNFRHIPVADTQDTLNPYPVRFTLKTMALPNAAVRDVRVCYLLNESEVEYRVPVTSVVQGEMEALIPAQPAGTMVTYWIVATEGASGEEVRFLANPRTAAPWRFLVGYHLVFTDPFEEDFGWTIGAAEDRATQGKWERADPEEIDLGQFGGPYLQPGDDHTEDGTLCYVTGARGGFNFMNSLPNGRTTLTSPVLDLRSTSAPLIRLHYFFALLINPQAEDPEPAYLRVELSDDGGETWGLAFETDRQALMWTPLEIPLASRIALTDAVLFRVVLEVPGGGGGTGMPDVLAKALVDDFAIFSAQPGAVTPVDPVATPRTVSISGVYPHPLSLHTSTTIVYRLEEAGPIALDIHDMLGRRVAALVRTRMPAGEHAVQWDGRSMRGVRVPAGTYILSLTTSHEVATRTLVIR